MQTSFHLFLATVDFFCTISISGNDHFVSLCSCFASICLNFCISSSLPHVTFWFFSVSLFVVTLILWGHFVFLCSYFVPICSGFVSECDHFASLFYSVSLSIVDLFSCCFVSLCSHVHFASFSFLWTLCQDSETLCSCHESFCHLSVIVLHLFVVICFTFRQGL